MKGEGWDTSPTRMWTRMWAGRRRGGTETGMGQGREGTREGMGTHGRWVGLGGEGRGWGNSGLLPASMNARKSTI